MPKGNQSSDTITINKEIQGYAEEFVPIANQIQYFYDKQSELFEAFNSYRGGAKEEIDEYASAQLNQLYMLITGYQTLSANLVSIIEAFVLADEERAKQFTNTLMNKTGSTVLNHFQNKTTATQTSGRKQELK